MDSNLTSYLSPVYKGNIVYSGSKQVLNTDIEVCQLNNLLVKISFKLNSTNILFRAMLHRHEEGLLMLIQDRVTTNYILSGRSGFLHKKPNVHGGLITRLNSFYFHISLDLFNGTNQEVYFLGKKEEEYVRKVEERKVKVHQFF